MVEKNISNMENSDSVYLVADKNISSVKVMDDETSLVNQKSVLLDWQTKLKREI